MLQAVHGWSSTYERLVKSQKFFSSYLTQEDSRRIGRGACRGGTVTAVLLVGTGGKRGQYESRNDKNYDDAPDLFHGIYLPVFFPPVP